MEARVEERSFRFTRKFTPQAWFTAWSDVLGEVLRDLAEVGDSVKIVVDGARGRAAFCTKSCAAMALYSSRWRRRRGSSPTEG